MLAAFETYSRSHPRLRRIALFWQRVFLLLIAARPGRLSAALSFYTIFSIVPLLVLVLMVAGIFLETAAVADAIKGRLFEYFGPQGGELFSQALDTLTSKEGSLWAFGTGVVALTFAALGAFSELQDGLDAIWERVEERTGVRGFLVQKVLSFGMIMTLAFLLLVTFVTNTFFSFFSDVLGPSPLLVFLVALLNQGIAALFVLVLFLLIFKTLPAATVSWTSAAVGGVVSTMLFLLGRSAFSFYIETSATLSLYGNAGAILAFLLFVYYTGFILYFGASVTRVADEVRDRRQRG